MKHKYSTFTSVLITCTIVIGFSALFVASSSVEPITRTQYASTERKPDSITLKYTVPAFDLTPQTQQVQTKGDITIIVTPQVFTASRMVNKSETIASSENPEFDKYQVKHHPYYEITPDRVMYDVRIKSNYNNGSVLELSKVVLLLRIDDKAVALNDDKFKTQWISEMVPDGIEKTYYVPGPKLDEMHSSKLVGLEIQGVPVKVDQAGNVSKREKFEWFFNVRSQDIIKKDAITYSYRTEPVYKEVCSQCRGIGYFTSTKTCTTCAGTGITTDSKGNKYKCFTCGGDGKVTSNPDCLNCVGGKIAHRKSSDPAISQQWTGWYVNVVTTPAGARVSTFNSSSQSYVIAGNSPVKIEWLNPVGRQYPILIESGGASVKVMPYTTSNKQSSKVQVDFTSGSPLVKGGNVAN